MISGADIDTNKETAFLDSLVDDYADQSPYSKAKKDVINSLIDKYVCDSRNKYVLQLGCSNGYETRFLIDRFKSVDVVDGSREFIRRTRESNGSEANFINCLFEEYDSQGKKYDYIICNYVLEHVVNAVHVLRNIGNTLVDGGVIISVVPNANAFSRQLAKRMGLIKDLKELTKNDLKHGHRRVYDRVSLINDFEKAGFEVTQVEGVIFKILADFQLNELLKNDIITKEHIQGLQDMASGQIDFCDSIFIMAKLKGRD